MMGAQKDSDYNFENDGDAACSTTHDSHDDKPPDAI